MSHFDRREFLKGLLGKLALATGTVVLASAAAPSEKTPGEKREGTEPPPEDIHKKREGTEPPPEDIQKRADQLPRGESRAEEVPAEAVSFLNGGFRNTPWGAFRNRPFGRFRNTPLGRFRNTPLGRFRNTPLGSFGNGGWPNGGWGGFQNGGWPNYGWLNW